MRISKPTLAVRMAKWRRQAVSLHQSLPAFGNSRLLVTSTRLTWRAPARGQSQLSVPATSVPDELPRAQPPGSALNQSEAQVLREAP